MAYRLNIEIMIHNYIMLLITFKSMKIKLKSNKQLRKLKVVITLILELFQKNHKVQVKIPKIIKQMKFSRLMIKQILQNLKFQ